MISQRQPASEVPPGCSGARGPGAATAAFRTLRREGRPAPTATPPYWPAVVPILTSTRDGGPRFGVTSPFTV